ncbi:hypothetical protein Cgig2_003859 [Carnegiea gigantea]|uniref:Uncharacterized protein n=1 Tax=Carnegiea gigantea TaxID=171969 RepID=A0A9Q1K296_9CARY|nr:hypothetical protein Cgig2_003859 [Carnegiea gigantea]
MSQSRSKGPWKLRNASRPLSHFDYMPTTGCKPSHQHVHEPSPIILRRIRRPLSRTEVVDLIQGTVTCVQLPLSGRAATQSKVRGHPILWRPLPMTAPPKLYNTRKYCEIHEQNEHTIAECWELRKALYELADKEQIDRFLEKGSRFLHREREATQSQPREEECSIEVVTTIAGGYAKGMTRSA